MVPSAAQPSEDDGRRVLKKIKRRKRKKRRKEEEEETRLGLPTHQGVRACHVAGHPSGEEEEDELEQFCFSLLCLTIRFYPRALGIKGETDNVCWG